MLENLYRENYPIVYGYLLSLCGDPALAEDLTAETFLRAVEKISTYNAAYRPSTWLCTIGRNLYRNHLKRSKRHTDLPEELPCRAPSPEVLLLQREHAQQVLQAAENLPDQQRQVLYMRMEGMSFRSIGLALGKSENWARVTFFRAKTKLLEETEEVP